LNFIFGIVCLFVCVCAFSLRRESPDMILGDKPLIFEVVLSHHTSLNDAELAVMFVAREEASLEGTVEWLQWGLTILAEGTVQFRIRTFGYISLALCLCGYYLPLLPISMLEFN
jgi:hypothetical protein